MLIGVESEDMMYVDEIQLNGLVVIRVATAGVSMVEKMPFL